MDNNTLTENNINTHTEDIAVEPTPIMEQPINITLGLEHTHNITSNLTMDNIPTFDNDEKEDTSNTLIIIIISTIIIYFIYRLFGKGKKQFPKNAVMIIGPTNSGKTSFFYYLTTNEQKDTVNSMDVNSVENYNITSLDNKSLDILDIPGQGFFRSRIIESIPRAKAIIVFLDSTEKQNITFAAEYIYDVLNSDLFDESIPMIIACNKQDLKFPKSKKVIESELNNEVENIKLIKQKNNLEESQIGTLFSLKSKFNFTLFKNVQFVETDRTNKYEALISLIKKLI